MASNKEHVTEKVVTGKVELTGFISLIKPSTKFNKQGIYSTYALLNAKEGKEFEQKMKDIRTEQFKKYGKGTKLAELQCKPYTIQDENTGEETPDPQGRYILTAKANAYIENGKPKYKPQIFNAKKQPITGNISIGEGTIARLGVTLSGYSVAGKTGVSVKLGLVQIIDLVEYSSSGFNLDELDEEEGFDGVGTEFTEEVNEEVTEEAAEGEDEEEADF